MSLPFYLAGIESKLKTIAITSTNPGEGKSVTCVNLGRIMALDGRNVVIVDCNEHRPSIGRLLKVPCEAGLMNVLTGACTLDQAIAPAYPSNLHILTTGPLVLNFPELLVSEKGREVFGQLAERFDTVLIDCLAVSCFSDLQAISMLADAFLMVVALTKTKESDLVAAVHNLNKLQTPVLSLVVRGEGTPVNVYHDNGSVPLVLPAERDKVKR